MPMVGNGAAGAAGLLGMGSGVGGGGGGGSRSGGHGAPQDGSACALRLLVAALDRGVWARGRGRNPSPAKIDGSFSLKGVDIKKNSKELSSFPPSTSFFSFSK